MADTTVRDELEQIRLDNSGQLTPSAVVEAARAVDHPLHARFTWDDDVAAHRYRISQARELIRSVRVTYVDRHQEPVSVRAYHSVPSAFSSPGRTYVPVEEVALDDFTRTQLLRAMDIEWRAFKRRYRQLEEFAKLLQRESDEAQGRERQTG